jgi:hypothetical protein
LRKYRYICLLAAWILAVGPAAQAAKAKLTSHREMTARLATREAIDSIFGHNRLHVTSIGKSVKGKDILLAAVTSVESRPEDTRRLFVICRQHGDEPATTEAMLDLIDDLVLTDSEATADLLRKVSIYIVPMVNPDGADHYGRRNAAGTDLNRDWLTLSQPETRAVRAAIDDIQPDVFIDEHELSPNNSRSDFIESAGPVCGALPEVVDGSAEIQKLIVGMLRTHDITVRSLQIDYQHPARLAHRYFPVRHDTMSFLFETRQSGYRQYQLQYRMKLHIVGTMTVAKYLAGQDDSLRQRIAQYDASRRWIQLASRGKKQSAGQSK